MALNTDHYTEDLIHWAECIEAEEKLMDALTIKKEQFKGNDELIEQIDDTIESCLINIDHYQTKIKGLVENGRLS